MTRTERTLCFFCLLVGLAYPLVGCSNFIVHNRSLSPYTVHVYINNERRCILRRGESCRHKLKPGRYTFYAIVPGKPKFSWASARKPAVFVVDRETVIDLHRRSGEGQQTSHQGSSSLQRDQ